MASPILIQTATTQDEEQEKGQVMNRDQEQCGVFTTQMLDAYLYGKKPVSAIDSKKLYKECDRQITSRPNGMNDDHCVSLMEGRKTPPLKSLQYFVHTKEPQSTTMTSNKPLTTTEGTSSGKYTYAMTSFPAEVQLCTSSIPGIEYGVCTRQEIPAGTWIGPYEGRRMTDHCLINLTENNEYLWEIYDQGTVSHFLDGSDENCSSWMRFIRCARDKKEQNLSAYQHGQNIYYRTSCDISCGNELLVWYSDCYIKHLEIPINLIDTDSEDEETTEIRSRRHQMSKVQSCPVENTSNCTIAKIDFCTVSSQEEYFPSDTTLPKLHYSAASKEKEKPHVSQKTACDTRTPSGKSEDGSGIKESLLSSLCSPFQCKQCLKVFTQRIQLQMHVCPKAPYKPFQCGHCSASFARPLELRNHVVIHTNERPFKCGFCGRSFAGATTLNNHVRTHTGEKPFICNNCGKTFSIATQLSRHSKTPGECNGFNK